MIEVNKNTLAGAFGALGKLICRTSPLALCKSIKVDATEGKLRLSTCGLNEEVSFELETSGEEVFCCLVGFDEFRDAVKSGRNKTVEVAFEAGLLLVGDRYLMTVKDVEWPDFTPKTEVKSCELPEGVVGMFARAAQAVDRNEVRAILRGINLCSGGITGTNGRELVNYDIPLDLGDSLTIPLPLALIQSKASVPGTFSYWPCSDTDFRFRIQVGPWCWTGKALQGIYPNWKQVIPESNALTRSIAFQPECGQALAAFLKNIPNNEQNNAVELAAVNNTLEVRSKDQGTSIAAEFTGDWNNSIFMNKAILLRMLLAGHTRIELGDGFSTLIATGGTGRYIAMPLRNAPIKTQPQIQPQPIKEESKMENTETKVVSAPMQMVAPKQEPETAPNPLDDLGVAIETFKAKMKASFDEVAALARKVKEVQIAQKQKERDFIQARRAIERIRIASGF
ncbi:MAG: hypothetical protein E7055_07400 [Lentisphaerae bacterium]|nr:hypothetical protein [Lentisphaerota bacterium]